VIASVKMQINIMLQSLKMPLEDLAGRQEALKHKLAEIERQRLMAADLLEGDRQRTLEVLEEQAENLRQKARCHLTAVLKDACAAKPHGLPDEARIEEAIAAAIPEFFEHELGEMARTFDRHVTAVLQPHQQRANDLTASIRKAAAELFAIPYQAPETEGIFQMKRQPYWVAHKWPSSFNPVPLDWLEKFLPAAVQRTRIMKRLEEEVESLVRRNVENLRWATFQNLNATFRQFAAELNEKLKLALAATQGAIQAAWDKRQQETGTVAREVSRLEAALARLEGIERELKD